MVVRNTWAQNGAPASARRSTGAPCRSTPFTRRASGAGRSRTTRSSSSRTPTPGLAATTATGRSFCWAAPAASPRSNLLGGERRALQVLAQQLVVRLGGRLDERRAGGLGLGLHVGRDLRLGELAEGAVVEVGLHAEEVDDPLQPAGGAGSDGELHRDGLHLEGGLDVGERAAEVGLVVVDAAEDGDGRASRLGQHVVDALGAVVRAVHRGDHQHAAVGNLKRPLGLVDEGGEARGVERVEGPAALLEGLGVDGQREVALLLLGVGVEPRGGTLRAGPPGVGGAEEGLDEGGLPGAVGAEDGEGSCDAGSHFVSGSARVGGVRGDGEGPIHSTDQSGLRRVRVSPSARGTPPARTRAVRARPVPAAPSRGRGAARAGSSPRWSWAGRRTRCAAPACRGRAGCEGT